MARRDEAAKLLRRGHSLLDIAREMNITIETVMQYLRTKIGEGEIKHSDIYLSVPAIKREAIERNIEQYAKLPVWKFVTLLKKNGCDIDEKELKCYLAERERGALFGDMYQYIMEIELTLHDKIRENLAIEFGEDWWRKGVPQNVRIECAKRREEDNEPVKDTYCYTTFTQLKTIVEKRWRIFGLVLPPELASNKQILLKELERINDIRNKVMHPVKTSEFTEEEFRFMRDYLKKITRDKWRRCANTNNEKVGETTD